MFPVKRRIHNACICDAEREILINYHIEKAKEYQRVELLCRFHIDRARYLIGLRPLDFEKRLEQGLV